MKKVLFDTIFLSMLLHQKDRLPLDPSTKKEVTRPKERIEYLIEVLEQDDAKIIIPTPAIGELLAAAGPSGPQYLSELHGNTVFKIEPYDERAAVENGALEASGARRVGDEPRQKVKVDRQIVSIAKVHGVEAIYSDDKGIVLLGDDLGIKVVRVSDLPLPPVEPVPPLLEISEAETSIAPALPSAQTPSVGRATTSQLERARPSTLPVAQEQRQPDPSPADPPRSSSD